MKAIWGGPSEPDRVRTLAFTTWLRAVVVRTSASCAIGRSETYYSYALQHRVKLGDKTAEDEVIEKIRGEWGGFWWVLAHRVWGERLHRFASQALAHLKDAIPTDFKGGRTDMVYHLTDMLTKIPSECSEALLKEHWEHLQYSPMMVLVALRNASPDCLALVRDTMIRCPREIRVFEHAFMRWEWVAPENPLCMRHLIALEPYLDRMVENEMLSLSRTFERVDDPDGAIARWLQKHVVPRVSAPGRTNIRSTDEHFLYMLDDLYERTQIRPFAIHEIREPTTQHDFPQRYLALLDNWLKAHANLRGLQVVAEQIAYIGSRSDIAILTKYRIEGTIDEIEAILADATFRIRRRTLS